MFSMYLYLYLFISPLIFASVKKLLLHIATSPRQAVNVVASLLHVGAPTMGGESSQSLRSSAAQSCFSISLHCHCFSPPEGVSVDSWSSTAVTPQSPRRWVPASPKDSENNLEQGCPLLECSSSAICTCLSKPSSPSSSLREHCVHVFQKLSLHFWTCAFITLKTRRAP